VLFPSAKRPGTGGDETPITNPTGPVYHPSSE
jgi:hypothetical protein